MKPVQVQIAEWYDKPVYNEPSRHDRINAVFGEGLGAVPATMSMVIIAAAMDCDAECIQNPVKAACRAENDPLSFINGRPC